MAFCHWCGGNVTREHRVMLQIDHVAPDGRPAEVGTLCVLCMQCTGFLNNAVGDARKMLPWVTADDRG